MIITAPTVYKGQIAPRSFRKQRIITPKMNTIHFFVAIAVVACWAIPATAQTTTTKTTTRPPYPPGVCGKYFPYYTSMYCWELGGRCYCASFCNMNNYGCGGGGGDWERSYEFCLEQNMTLLTIETQQEDKMIYDFLQLNHEYSYSVEPYWTSGKYFELGSQWEWNHYGNETVAPAGTPIDYTNWYPGRPNNKDGRCLGLVFQYGVTYENGHWDEFSCEDHFNARYICEASP